MCIYINVYKKHCMSFWARSNQALVLTQQHIRSISSFFLFFFSKRRLTDINTHTHTLTMDDTRKTTTHNMLNKKIWYMKRENKKKSLFFNPTCWEHTHACISPSPCAASPDWSFPWSDRFQEVFEREEYEAQDCVCVCVYVCENKFNSVCERDRETYRWIA